MDHHHLFASKVETSAESNPAATSTRRTKLLIKIRKKKA